MDLQKQEQIVSTHRQLIATSERSEIMGDGTESPRILGTELPLHTPSPYI